MADRIVILNAGSIAQAGTPEEVYNRPASPFVASFMGAENVVLVEARRDGERLVVAAGDDHDPVHVPIGTGGMHLAADAAPGPSGRVAVHFRTEAARLIAPDGGSGHAPENALVLRGRITQAAYPGGRWRYGVAVGGRSYLVDDDERRTAGDLVGIAIPPSALHGYPASGSA